MGVPVHRGRRALDGADHLEVRAPFVHKVRTKQHRYLLDVNTSRMLGVPLAVWDIVDEAGVLPRADLVARYSDRYHPSVISDALDVILAAQAKGLLSPSRPKEVVCAYSERSIAQELADRRNSVTLVPTEQCNFRCSYCVYGGAYAHCRVHSPEMMSWDVARPAIDEFLAHSSRTEDPRSIRFYGGEPLLAMPLLRRCVDYVRQDRKRADIDFAMTTNGSLLRGDVADFLAEHQFRMNVSLDGPEHIHDRCRRRNDGSPTWRLVMDNLRAFLDKHPEYSENGRLGFHAVVTPPTNLLEVEKFFGSCDLFQPGMAFSLAYVSNLDTTYPDCMPADQRRIEGSEALHEKFVRNLCDGTWGRDRGKPSLWVQRALFEKEALFFYKRGYASPEDPLLPERLSPLPMCVPGVRRLFVNTDGSYYPCERVQETESFCIGNVSDGVSAARVADLLRGFVDLGKQECCSCWCVAMCLAGCVVVVMKDGKMDAAVRAQACDYYRAVADRAITDVCEALEVNPQAMQFANDVTFT